MVSFIITSRDKKQRGEYINKFALEHNVSHFDISVFDNNTSIDTQTIGIDDIKKMQETIYLKPVKSHDKIVVIEDAENLTVPAQNALLKLLEEPPDNTFIFISTESKETILMTIISRCQILKLDTQELKLTDSDRQIFNSFLEELQSKSIADKLKKAESLSKDKDKALKWLEKLILTLHVRLLENPQNSSGAILALKNFNRLYVLLKTTNVNTRFAIENAFLN